MTQRLFIDRAIFRGVRTTNKFHVTVLVPARGRTRIIRQHGSRLFTLWRGRVGFLHVTTRGHLAAAALDVRPAIATIARLASIAMIYGRRKTLNHFADGSPAHRALAHGFRIIFALSL